MKLLPHLFLPEYDASLWIDSNIRLQAPVLPIVQESLSSNSIGCLCHLDRDCIYHEAEAVLSGLYDNVSLVFEQMHRYRAMGFPQHYGLTSTNFLARRHNEARCRFFDELWWSELRQYSKRDQLSFDFVRWAATTPVYRMPFSYMDNQFFIWGDKGRGGHTLRDGSSVEGCKTEAHALPEKRQEPQTHYTQAFLETHRRLKELPGGPSIIPWAGDFPAPVPTAMYAPFRTAVLLAVGTGSLPWVFWALECNPALQVLMLGGQPESDMRVAQALLKNFGANRFLLLEGEEETVLHTLANNGELEIFTTYGIWPQEKRQGAHWLEFLMRKGKAGAEILMPPSLSSPVVWKSGLRSGRLRDAGSCKYYLRAKLIGDKNRLR